jgi:hypothetical protein
MNIIAKLCTLSLVTAAAAVAQAPHQVGAWTVYTAAENSTGKEVVMLQTQSANQYQNANGDSVAAKLDVICRNHKVAAVVLETPSMVNKHDVKLEQAVPTTKVILAVEGHDAVVENWAIADGGHSLTPYSELSQNKLNHVWVDRISDTSSLALHIGAKEMADDNAPMFGTEGLAAALQSVGCSK